MARSSYSLSLALFAAVVATPSSATAQTIPSAFTYIEGRQEAGLYSGYMSVGTGRFGYGPSGGILSGARYAVELTGPLSLEGNLGLVSGARDIVNPARLEGDQVVGEADVLLTIVDARLRFSFVGNRAWHGVNPFLTFGGGIVFDAAAQPPEEADLEPEDVFDFGNSFFGSIGAGARWFLTDTFALRADGLFSLHSIDTPPGYSLPERGFVNVEEGEWLSGLSFSVTLLYRW